MNNSYFKKQWLILLTLALIITGCWENREGILFPPETTAPTVNSTSPVNASTQENINIKVTATFSEAMDVQTISTSTFIVTRGAETAAGTVTYSGATAIFSPADNLHPNTLYTGTITTGVKDKVGNSMYENYVWTFTTGSAPDITAPIISFTDPANSTINVAFNKKIAITFSETMDPASINSTSIMLNNGSTNVMGSVSYSGVTAIFTPSVNLLPNTLYTGIITTEAKDLAENHLANNYVWSFATGATADNTPPTVILTDPVNFATGVAQNKTIKATFSEAIDASTVTTATFTVMQNSVFISGTVSFSGMTAVFTPSENLSLNETYTATITTGIRDLANNSMLSNFVWSFSTSPLTQHTVTLASNPANGGTTSGAGTFNAGTLVNVTATPETGFFFTNWTEGTNIVSTSSSYSFPITSDRILTANFSNNPIQHSVVLNANPVAGGTTSGAGTYVSGSSVTVTANANSGFTFTNWTEGANVVSTSSSYTFTIVEDKILTANFTANPGPYTVTLASNPLLGGTTSGAGSFSAGSSVTVTANANSGFTFTNWTEGANVVSTSSSYTFMINGNRILTANFAANPVPYTVTLASNPLLGGTTSGAGSFSAGSSVTVTANANSGFTFTNWTEGVNIVSTSSSYTFTINGNRILTANFAAGGQLPVPLGSAARFAILSNSAITNIPTSAITGDVGISPGARAAITALSNPEVTGEIFAADDPAPVPAMLIAAKADAQIAFLNANAAVRGTPTPISGNLNGLTLVPGLYESGTSIEISPGGILYLDAGGNSNAVFVIRSATSITTGPTATVVLQGGANAANIFWTAGSAITLGTNSVMKGTMIAGTSISLLTQARLDGRALIQGAAAGQVSLDQSTVIRP
jgi:hypothetical protein